MFEQGERNVKNIPASSLVTTGGSVRQLASRCSSMVGTSDAITGGAGGSRLLRMAAHKAGGAHGDQGWQLGPHVAVGWCAMTASGLGRGRR